MYMYVQILTCMTHCMLRTQTKSRVDDFKELQGLIAALFNPGLRERHWEKMSSIAGQNLQPTEVYILGYTVNTQL